MATKYKVWIEIERIDNAGTDEELYSDEECPIGVAYCDSIEDAVALQEEIEKVFGDI